MTNLDSVLKSRDIILPTKIHTAKAMVSPVVMYGYESWIIKKAERWGIGAFELWHWRRLLRVPWTAKRWNTVNPKGNQPWIFTGKTDAKTEAPILFLATWYEHPIHSLEKTLMLGDWGQDAKGVTEDKTAEWHHQLNGHESNQAPGDDEGQGSLLCCSPWHHKESDKTERLNNNKNWAPIMSQTQSFQRLTRQTRFLPSESLQSEGEDAQLTKQSEYSIINTVMWWEIVDHKASTV